MNEATEERRWGGFRFLIGVLIFVGFVWFVESWLGWQELLTPWTQLAPASIAAAAALVFLSYGVRALRLYHYFRDAMGGRYLLCLKLFLQHNVLNNIMPMRSGELSFPVLMTRYFSVPVVRSVPALAWFRFLDLHALLTIAQIVGIALYGTFWLIPVVGLWLALPWVVYRLNGWMLARLASAPRGRPGRLVAKALNHLPRTIRDFWFAWFWTWVNWLVKLGVFAWVFTLFAPVSAYHAWIAAIAGDLTSVLPVHGVAGAGTFEAGVVAALLPFGISAQTSLPAAVNLHLFLLGAALFGGAASLLLPTPARARRS